MERTLPNTSDSQEDVTKVAPDYFPSVPDMDEYVHCVVVEKGVEPERKIEVGSQPVAVGRGADAGLQLPDPGISRKHCTLQVQDDRLTLTDLRSTNGTFVNDQLVQGTVTVPSEGRIALGEHVLRYQRRLRDEAMRSQSLQNDLRKAVGYVKALLPPPRREGTIRTNWCFSPSALLGGDAFGYHELDSGRFAVYLIDVCGHGAGPALHSVSVLNVLRTHTLPSVDFDEPSQVLAGLNRAFQMDDYDQMNFSMWYGVFDPATRELAYSSAGHPPALLVGPGRESAGELGTRSLAIGSFPEVSYRSERVKIQPSSSLYVFSDGAFEIVTAQGREWSFGEFKALVLEPPLAMTDESLRLKIAVESIAGDNRLDDDFSLLVVEFD